MLQIVISTLRTVKFADTGINWYLVSVKKKFQGVPFFSLWVHLCNIFFTFVTYFLHIVYFCTLFRITTNECVHITFAIYSSDTNKNMSVGDRRMLQIGVVTNWFRGKVSTYWH